MMQRYNLSKRFFDTDDLNSDVSGETVICISSDESGEVSDEWESNCSTDTDRLIERIEREVCASPMLIVGRARTVEGEDEEKVAGPSTSHTDKDVTAKLGSEYFDERLTTPPTGKVLYREFDCAKPSSQWLIHLCHRPGPVDGNSYNSGRMFKL